MSQSEAVAGDGFRDTDTKENQWPSTRGNEFLSKADVPGLKNGVRAPLAYLLACETSSPIYTPGSFAASLVLQPDGGAITVIGATRPTWTVTDWDPAANNNLDPALATRFWQLFFDPAQGNFRAGLALNRAKDWYAAQFRPSLNLPGALDRVELMAMVITGDPELPIWTDRPGALQLQGLARAGDRLAVTVVDGGGKPVADAQVTVWLQGDLARRQLYQTVRSGADGRAEVPLGGVTAGAVQVTAVKHNYVPVSLLQALNG